MEASARDDAQAAFDRVMRERKIEIQNLRDAAAVMERGAEIFARREAAGASPGAVVPISPLPSDSQSGITYSMDSTQIDSGIKKRRTGPPLKSKGPIAKVARLLGLSFAELATEIKANVHSLRTWDQRDQVPGEVKSSLAALVKAHEKQAKRAR